MLFFRSFFRCVGYAWIFAAASLAHADVAQGLEAFNRLQFVEARKELAEPAAKGNPDAMAVMGEMLWRGQGGARDEIRARDYITQSEKQGSLYGTYFLGRMLMFGWLVPKDEKRGIDMVKDAANKGLALAQANLGAWIANGTYGHEKSDAIALTWFQAAAEKNNAIAMNWIGGFYEQGRGGLTKDPLVGIEWFKKSAARNNPFGLTAVGRMYATGVGVPADGNESLRWFYLAVVQNDPNAYLWIANVFEYGRGGVAKNPSLAYSWQHALPADATAELLKESSETKERLAKTLSRAEIDEAIRQARGVVESAVAAAKSAALQAGSEPYSARKGVYGSGVVVSRAGDIITNEHVIQGCTNVRIQPQGNAVKIVAKDAKNDLALLRVEGVRIPSVRTRSGRGIRLGDELVAVGYPLRDLISTGPTVTTGIVNALSGVNNDTSAFQMSATVQPGSSGGPIVDTHGLLVGIVRSRLLPNGPISPQNVNFGINLATVQSFLDAHSVDYESSAVSPKPMSVGDVTALTQRSAVQVECY
jgi:TPR repeat protein/S1-C subfamily serine protease